MQLASKLKHKQQSHLNMATIIFIRITAVDDKQPLNQIVVLSAHCFNHLKIKKKMLTENEIVKDANALSTYANAY